MNKVKEILNINKQELERGLAGTSGSWHTKYAQSAWVYVGGLAKELTEGDVICVLSQYGEIEDFVLHRDPNTGESKGFAHAKYEDARSCVLAVDNFCGVEICGRNIVVDHVENKRLPKDILEKEEDTAEAIKAGVAYKDQELASSYSLHKGQDLFAAPSSTPPEKEESGKLSKEEKQKLRQEKEERKRERARIRAEREERRQKRRSKRSNKDREEGDDDSRKEKKKKRKKDRH